MKKIQVGGKLGSYALVDDEDFEIVSKYKWYHKDNGSKGYAVTTTKVQIRMHVLIMSPPKGSQVDHINQNTFDNRRSNLRICSLSENQWNRQAPKNNKSGFKGVSWRKRERKWLAMINYKKKKVWLGTYDTLIEAAKAYNEAAIKYHGKFALLNKIT